MNAAELNYKEWALKNDLEKAVRYKLQSVTKYLRLALGFVWNGASLAGFWGLGTGVSFYGV